MRHLTLHFVTLHQKIAMVEITSQTKIVYKVLKSFQRSRVLKTRISRMTKILSKLIFTTMDRRPGVDPCHCMIPPSTSRSNLHAWNKG